MKPPKLPSLRALQVFASFGRTLSVTQTAQELGVTSGAVSQQLKVLEEQTGRSQFNRQGRVIFLRPGAKAYHKQICEGFETLAQAQHILDRLEDTADISISALPSLLSRWLNQVLSAYQDHHQDLSLRLDSTHKEPERHLLSTTFRLTYGANADTFPYRRHLFQDAVFPVCAPAFLSQFPSASDPAQMAQLPLLHTDWGPAHRDLPSWGDWFSHCAVDPGTLPKGATYSLSSLTLEAAIAGKGIALAQTSFVARDLQSGRLIRLSEAQIQMPQPYFICWGEGAMQSTNARDLLDWITSAAREFD